MRHRTAISKFLVSLGHDSTGDRQKDVALVVDLNLIKKYKGKKGNKIMIDYEGKEFTDIVYNDAIELVKGNSVVVGTEIVERHEFITWIYEKHPDIMTIVFTGFIDGHQYSPTSMLNVSAELYLTTLYKEQEGL